MTPRGSTFAARKKIAGTTPVSGKVGVQKKSVNCPVGESPGEPVAALHAPPSSHSQTLAKVQKSNFFCLQCRKGFVFEETYSVHMRSHGEVPEYNGKRHAIAIREDPPKSSTSLENSLPSRKLKTGKESVKKEEAACHQVISPTATSPAIFKCSLPTPPFISFKKIQPIAKLSPQNTGVESRNITIKSAAITDDKPPQPAKANPECGLESSEETSEKVSLKDCGEDEADAGPSVCNISGLDWIRERTAMQSVMIGYQKENSSLKRQKNYLDIQLQNALEKVARAKERNNVGCTIGREQATSATPVGDLLKSEAALKALLKQAELQIQKLKETLLQKETEICTKLAEKDQVIACLQHAKQTLANSPKSLVELLEANQEKEKSGKYIKALAAELEKLHQSEIQLKEAVNQLKTAHENSDETLCKKNMELSDAVRKLAKSDKEILTLRIASITQQKLFTTAAADFEQAKKEITKYKAENVKLNAQLNVFIKKSKLSPSKPPKQISTAFQPSEISTEKRKESLSKSLWASIGAKKHEDGIGKVTFKLLDDDRKTVQELVFQMKPTDHFGPLKEAFARRLGLSLEEVSFWYPNRDTYNWWLEDHDSPDYLLMSEELAKGTLSFEFRRVKSDQPQQ